MCSSVRCVRRRAVCRCLHEQLDRGEGVAEFVSYARRHFAHCRQSVGKHRFTASLLEFIDDLPDPRRDLLDLFLQGGQIVRGNQVNTAYFTIQPTCRVFQTDADPGDRTLEPVGDPEPQDDSDGWPTIQSVSITRPKATRSRPRCAVDSAMSRSWIFSRLLQDSAMVCADRGHSIGGDPVGPSGGLGIETAMDALPILPRTVLEWPQPRRVRSGVTVLASASARWPSNARSSSATSIRV